MNSRQLSARALIGLVQGTFPYSDLRMTDNSDFCFSLYMRESTVPLVVKGYQIRCGLLGHVPVQARGGLAEAAEKVQLEWRMGTSPPGERGAYTWKPVDTYEASSLDDAVGWVSWVRGRLTGTDSPTPFPEPAYEMPNTAKLVWEGPDLHQSTEDRFLDLCLNAVTYKEGIPNTPLRIIFPRAGESTALIRDESGHGSALVDASVDIIEALAAAVLRELVPPAPALSELVDYISRPGRSRARELRVHPKVALVLGHLANGLTEPIRPMAAPRLAGLPVVQDQALREDQMMLIYEEGGWSVLTFDPAKFSPANPRI